MNGHLYLSFRLRVFKLFDRKIKSKFFLYQLLLNREIIKNNKYSHKQWIKLHIFDYKYALTRQINHNIEI